MTTSNYSHPDAAIAVLKKLLVWLVESRWRHQAWRRVSRQRRPRGSQQGSAGWEGVWSVDPGGGSEEDDKADREGCQWNLCSIDGDPVSGRIFTNSDFKIFCRRRVVSLNWRTWTELILISEVIYYSRYWNGLTWGSLSTYGRWDTTVKFIMRVGRLRIGPSRHDLGVDDDDWTRFRPRVEVLVEVSDAQLNVVPFFQDSGLVEPVTCREYTIWQRRKESTRKQGRKDSMFDIYFSGCVSRRGITKTDCKTHW